MGTCLTCPLSRCLRKVSLPSKTPYLVITLHLHCWLHFPFIFPDSANHTSRISTISNPLSKPTQPSSPPTSTPVSPLPTSLQNPSEDQQNFVTLTPPLAVSLSREEYLLSLAEDEGITDLFSSVDLDQLPLDVPLWGAILEIQSCWKQSSFSRKQDIKEMH